MSMQYYSIRLLTCCIAINMTTTYAMETQNRQKTKKVVLTIQRENNWEEVGFRLRGSNCVLYAQEPSENFKSTEITTQMATFSWVKKPNNVSMPALHIIDSNGNLYIKRSGHTDFIQIDDSSYQQSIVTDKETNDRLCFLLLQHGPKEWKSLKDSYRHSSKASYPPIW
jgi:hypothetical protein